MIQVHGFTFQMGWCFYLSIIRPSLMIQLFISLSYSLELDPPRAQQKSRLLFRLQSSSQQEPCSLELWFQNNPDTWEHRLTDSRIKPLRQTTPITGKLKKDDIWLHPWSTHHQNTALVTVQACLRGSCEALSVFRCYHDVFEWQYMEAGTETIYCDFSLQYFLNDICFLYIAGI